MTRVFNIGHVKGEEGVPWWGRSTVSIVTTISTHQEIQGLLYAEFFYDKGERGVWHISTFMTKTVGKANLGLILTDFKYYDKVDSTFLSLSDLTNVFNTFV